MTYPELVSALRARQRVPLDEIRRALAAAGKTPDDLLMAVFGESARPASGDPCPHCPGHYKVLNTRTIGQTRIRYMGCASCGFRPPGNVRATPVLRSYSQPVCESAD